MIVTGKILKSDLYLALRAPEKLVYLTLRVRANDQRKCWPSIDRISKDTGIQRVTIIKILKKLQLLGIIKKGPRWKNKATEYEVNNIDEVKGV